MKWYEKERTHCDPNQKYFHMCQNELQKKYLKSYFENKRNPWSDSWRLLGCSDQIEIGKIIKTYELDKRCGSIQWGLE